MTSKEYQHQSYLLLQQIFSTNSVRKEWSIANHSTDYFTDRKGYVPRLDLAVGPFNLSSENAFSDIESIKSKPFHPLVSLIIEKIQEQSNNSFLLNKNPRCLIAIELEWSTSSKHILGAFTNASMMGLVGVLVAPVDKINKVKRIAEYIKNLKRVEKAHPDLFGNIVYFDNVEFYGILNSIIK